MGRQLRGVDAGTRSRKNMQKSAKKSSEIEHVEEDRQRKCTTFTPANLHDYQNDGGNLRISLKTAPRHLWVNSH